MQILLFIIFILLLLYTLLILYYWKSWVSIPEYKVKNEKSKVKTRISVIIPARNEEENIVALEVKIIANLRVVTFSAAIFLLNKDAKWWRSWIMSYLLLTRFLKCLNYVVNVCVHFQSTYLIASVFFFSPANLRKIEKWFIPGRKYIL